MTFCATIARPIPVCADESAHDRASLAALVGKYDAVNIKLDKTGGLTEALAMAEEARRLGFSIMAGCMVATSLSMAPAHLIAQAARVVDLDGPLAARARPSRRSALRRQPCVSARPHPVGMTEVPLRFRSWPLHRFRLSFRVSFGDEGSQRMVVRAIVAGAVLAALASQPAFAVVRIANDAGGQIGPYLDRLASIRSSGQSVVIDGPCLSACTLLLGIIPRERICVTPRAQARLSRRLEAGRERQQAALPRRHARAVGHLSEQCARLAVAQRRAEAEDGVSERHRTGGDGADLPAAIGIGDRALSVRDPNFASIAAS